MKGWKYYRKLKLKQNWESKFQLNKEFIGKPYQQQGRVEDKTLGLKTRKRNCIIHSKQMASLTQREHERKWQIDKLQAEQKENSRSKAEKTF